MTTGHEFTLILDGISELSPSIMDALFEAGCDDATISSQGGPVSMDFDRTGPSMTEAVVSAIQDIRKANIGADVVRVEAETESKWTAAVNAALNLSTVTKFEPQLFRAVLPLIMSAPRA